MTKRNVPSPPKYRKRKKADDSLEFEVTLDDVKRKGLGHIVIEIAEEIRSYIRDVYEIEDDAAWRRLKFSLRLKRERTEEKLRLLYTIYTYREGLEY